MEDKKKAAYRVGVTVLILLITFTIGEYWIGSVAGTWWAPLFAISVAKAFFVIRDYMHLPRVFSGEEEAH